MIISKEQNYSNQWLPRVRVGVICDFSWAAWGRLGVCVCGGDGWNYFVP